MRENALLEALKILRVAAIASLPSLLVDDAPEHASITTKPLEPRRSRRYRGRALITGGIQFAEWARDLCGQSGADSGQHDQSASYQGN